MVEPETLERFRPAPDKALLIEQCVSLSDIDPIFFAGRSLNLLPDGPAARQLYGILGAALQRAGKVAIGRVVLATHRQLVLVRPRGPLLVMDVLHYPAQVRGTRDWESGLCGIAAAAEELRLACQLIDTASGPVDWARYRDTNNEELRALLDAKIADRVPADAAPAASDLVPVLEALKKSVAAAREQAGGLAPTTPLRARRRQSA